MNRASWNEVGLWLFRLNEVGWSQNLLILAVPREEMVLWSTTSFLNMLLIC